MPHKSMFINQTKIPSHCAKKYFLKRATCEIRWFAFLSALSKIDNGTEGLKGVFFCTTCANKKRTSTKSARGPLKMCEQILPIENRKKRNFTLRSVKKTKGFYFAEIKRAQAVQITIEPFFKTFCWSHKWHEPKTPLWSKSIRYNNNTFVIWKYHKNHHNQY